VPAAAVTPDQMVYIKIVVIKKFVVGMWYNGFVECIGCKCPIYLSIKSL
jgi:hypothetical protein